MANVDFPPLDVEDRANRDASWALVLGIVSLVVCAPLTAPFAIWKGLRAMRVAPRPPVRGVVGLALAFVGLFTSAVFWFLAVWQFLSPGDRRPPMPPAG
jgi:hypothetical protein